MTNTTTATRNETASLTLVLVLVLRILGILLYIGFVRPLVALQYTLARAQNALLDHGAESLAIRAFVQVKQSVREDRAR